MYFARCVGISPAGRLPGHGNQQGLRRVTLPPPRRSRTKQDVPGEPRERQHRNNRVTNMKTLLVTTSVLLLFIVSASPSLVSAQTETDHAVQAAVQSIGSGTRAEITRVSDH